MAALSSGLHDRLGSVRNDISDQMENCVFSGDHLVQRTVIVQKDEKGYGLTVSGHNPVFVQSIKEDGAAARVGVQEGDRIIKVNGTLVTQANHSEVVELIKSGSYVSLTLLGKPYGPNNRLSGGIQSNSLVANHGYGAPNKVSPPFERITGPQPVDAEKQHQLNKEKIHTIKKMLDKEGRYLEDLKSEFSKNPSDKLRQEMSKAEKRVKILEEQLLSFTSGTYPESVPRSPKSPPVRHPERETRSASLVAQPSCQLQGRTLVHQISAPVLPKSEQRGVTSPSYTNNSTRVESLTSSTGPLGSQVKCYRRETDLDSTIQISSPLSASLENIAKPASPKELLHPVRLLPTHSRQSSSPDSLLQFHQQKGDYFKPAYSLSRTQSELSHHPFGRKSDHLPDSVKKRRRQTNVILRGQSFSHNESSTDSPQITPPGTPPRSDLICDGMEIVEDEDTCQEEGCVTKDVLCSTTGNCSTTPAIVPEVKSNTFNPMDGRPLPALPLELKPVNTLISPSQQKYGTPPEMSPSPGQGSLQPSQYLIMSMEDEDWPSDSEVGLLENHGPFNAMWKLLRYQAHLAVFMYFLITNSEPASLFFYLITNSFQEGTVKEMKKWAYEIHSSFLVPGAPLKVKNIDETILNEIDDVLQNQLEKEDNLRSIFIKARRKAKEELNELLADFRSKRNLCLGNLFGPSDSQLEEAMQDKSKELKIIEQLLVPKLEIISEDVENANDKTLAMVAALATVLKQFGVKSQQAVNLIERCPCFVAKEKTKLKFLQRNKKPVFVRNHHFLPEHYYYVTFCNHCQLIIWGVGNQGYQCQNCEMNIHKSCVKIVEETCIGTIRNKKDKRRDRMSGIMENIIGKNRKPSQSTPGSIERTKKSNEDWSIHSETGFSYLYGSSGESQIDGGERTAVSFRCEPSRDRIESESEDCQAFHTDNTSSTMDDPNLVKKGNSIGRSESFRQQRENRVPIRKRSDPNIPRSKSDAEVDEKNTSDLNNSGSSSNSSLSTRSLDSPSISVEMVHKTPGGTPTDSASSSVPSTGPSPSTVPPSSSSSNFHQLDDSDLDAENDPPKWQENVNINVIRLMKPKEKKRQDVINELFHTERTHVRNLKVLDKLFFKPIQQEQLLTQDHLYLLFPNLEEMLKIHSNFNNIMKVCRREQQVVGDVGSIMLEMLDGHSGDRLKSEAATFCRNQSTALELLKNKQKKEQKLAQFLSDAEANQLCRRLQLKDIIATGFQRLTKYPLLLENIAKYTPQNSEEHSRLLRAVHCSKQILAYVNQAVKEAENEHRLSELQKKMDRSAFEKVEAPIVQNYRHLDLTKHRLIHEGPLIWRLHKQKTIEMHVVLFEDILVLLQKQDDKLLLKFHSNNLMSGREDTKITHSPILRVQNLFTRNVATDSKGFFLVSTSEQHAIYEFVASSASERKMWLKHITEAAEAHKPRHSQSAKCQDSSPTLPERQDNTQGNNLAKNKMMPNIITDDSIKIRKYSLDQDHLEVINNAESTETRESSSTVSLTAHPTPDTEVSSPNSSSTYLPEEDSSSLSPQKEAPSPCSSVEDHQQSLQGVELIHVPSEPQLIEPSEIKVSESTVLQTAVPLLTPIEMVRRKDKQIAEALAEKQDLVSKILQIPREEFEHVTETANEYEVATDVKQLVLASIHQANQLAGIVNEGLRVYEDDRISNTEVVADEDNSVYSETPSLIDPKKAGRLPGFPPLEKLLDISCKLNRQLTQILSHVTDKEEERIQLQLELHTSREQLHFLHETHRLCCGMISRSPSNLSVNQSRANSFISSTSDPVDENEDKTDILTGEKFKEVENDEISEEEKQNSFVGDEEINKVEQVQPEEEDENTDINFVYMTEEEKFKNQSLQQTQGHTRDKESSLDKEENIQQDILDEDQELNAECLNKYEEELKETCEEGLEKLPNKKVNDCEDEKRLHSLEETQEENHHNDDHEKVMNKEFGKCMKNHEDRNEEGGECKVYPEQDTESNGLSTPTEHFVDAISGEENISEYPVTDIDHEEFGDKCRDNQRNLAGETSSLPCSTGNITVEDQASVVPNVNYNPGEETQINE